MNRYLLVILASGFLFMSGAGAQDPGNPYGYLTGYQKTVRGDDFTYHSPQPNVGKSMLVRSMEKTLYIEWETEPVPPDYKSKEVRFIMMAAIDVNPENPHSWDIFINGVKEFTIKSPANDSNRKYEWKGISGYNLQFNAVLTDQYGDQHGYLILTAPMGRFENGKPLNIRVEGESANSQTWFMVFKYAMKPELKCIEEQAVLREGNNHYQQVRVEYVYMGEPAEAFITTGNLKTKASLSFGYNTIRAKVPVVSEKTSFPVSVITAKGRQVLATGNFNLEPVVKRTIHLLHHSHVDIGYTHVQDEVKEIQWKNLEDAARLAAESQSMPPEARFKWNSEVVWPIESYLREKEPEKVKAMKDAIARGWIELDAFYANELTELCTSEELIRLTADARRIASECGIKPKAAMITDIPGWSWGIVPVLAGSGVKYLSLGTNIGHRIGSTINDWGDRPFYWVSPSGEEKILCWIHEKAYSLFHTGLKYNELKYRLDEGKIFSYVNELYENNYPYEIITLRYNIGSDNGPADPTLSEAVKAWNEKYVTPIIKIMTVAESFSEFEEKHGSDIPSVSGAFTGYWEDGAASSALETGFNRKAASKINTAAALMVMNNNTGFNETKFNEAWRNVLLFDEHTWGSWNSISEPKDPFTLSQWKRKRQFATDALALGNELMEDALAGKYDAQGITVRRIEVMNTHSWQITDLVSLPMSLNLAGTRIRDLNGNIIPSQMLSNGNLVFVAHDVPALGSRIYTIEIENPSTGVAHVQSNNIENDRYAITVDRSTGSLSSFIVKGRNIDLVDKSELPGLNMYTYISGRSPDNPNHATAEKIEITDDGPVTKIIRVTSAGKGVLSLTSSYQLTEGLGKLTIKTVADKEKIFTPEGVHLAFPFHIPDGITHIDLAYGIYRPEYDQVKAACKNYFTPERWVDISNQDFGITWITPDAPLIEIGDITTDATAYGWIRNLCPSQTFYSYIMNNYWETNYKASQEGPVTFLYILYPHDMFIPQLSERLAIQESEPLVVVPVDDMVRERESLFKINGTGILVTALVPVSDGYLIRLFNSSGGPSPLDISWKDAPVSAVFCDFDGNLAGDYTDGTIIPAWGIRTLRIMK